MSDLRDFTGKNRRFSGTDSIRIPRGTTGERETAETGEFRFNTTLNKAEYYDGTSWIVIDAPPAVTSISPDNFADDDGSTVQTITLNGSNFSTGVSLKVTGQDLVELSPDSITRVSSSQITFVINSTIIAKGKVAGQDPFSVKVINSSGLSAILADALEYEPSPTFATAAGSLASLYDAQRSATHALNAGATSSDPDEAVTHAIQSGALPTGMSIASSTGIISGTPNAESSDTTYTFTVRATATSEDGSTKTNDRVFTIEVKAPVTTAFTYTGAIQTFAVPSGVSAINYEMWGAGGGAYDTSTSTGDGGAGGFQSGTIAVGSGGQTLEVIVGEAGGASGGPQHSLPNGSGGGPAAILAPSTWDSTSHSNTIAGIICCVGAGGGGGNTGGDAGNGSGTSPGGSRNSSYNGNGLGGTVNAGVTTIDQSDGTCTGNCTSTILRGATGCGGAESTSAVSWPMGVWGGTWGSSAGGNGCNGGGGGGGYYGGGGGGHVTPNNGGSGGGGAGYSGGYQTYTISNVSGTQATDGTATPPSNTATNYASGIAQGGQNADGGHARVVITY